VASAVRKAGYRYITTPDKPGEGARILAGIRDSGVNLMAFHAFPISDGRSQLNFVPGDERAFEAMAKKANLSFSEEKTVFLVEGDDRQGAMADLLARLAASGINVTAVDAIKAGPRFGALIWVKDADVDKAAKALGAT
jgi:hypothetical protein